VLLVREEIKHMSEDGKNINSVTEPDADKFPYGAKITIFLNGEIQFDVKDRIYQFGKNLTVKFVENRSIDAQYTERTFELLSRVVYGKIRRRSVFLQLH